MTQLPIDPPSGFRIRGVHVLIAVVAFFAVVISVDTAFTVLAVRTFPGQVSVTPYEDGLIYNRHLRQLRAQEALGWKAGAAAAPGLVNLVYADREGRPIRGLTIRGKLEHPATESGRLHLIFSETAPGQYSAPTGVIAGAWDLTAEAHAKNGAAFVAERRLTWP